MRIKERWIKKKLVHTYDSAAKCMNIDGCVKRGFEGKVA